MFINKNLLIYNFNNFFQTDILSRASNNLNLIYMQFKQQKSFNYAFI